MPYSLGIIIRHFSRRVDNKPVGRDYRAALQLATQSYYLPFPIRVRVSPSRGMNSAQDLGVLAKFMSVDRFAEIRIEPM